MTPRPDTPILVCGATGHQGAAVTRHLLAEGWPVRALTRDPASAKAQALGSLGAEVVQGDMGSFAAMRTLLDGVYGVYSVQNPMISGMEAEVQQGRNVANAAREAGVKHLVYGSAGTGEPGTGISSWESKLQIEAYTKELGQSSTILRPMALMELMTDKVYYPPVSTWQLMPKLMGEDRPVVWLAADDLGAIAAKVFANPDRYVDQDLRLAADVQSIHQCRELYRTVMGRAPRRAPMPVWLFERFVGPDLIAMWRWLATHEIDLDTGPTLAIHPDATTVEAWLHDRHTAQSGA